MNFLTRTFLKNVGSKRLLACNYIANEIRLSCAQYHSLNIPTKTHFEENKCNSVIKRNSAVLSNLKFAFLNFSLTLRDMYEHGSSYLPFFGRTECLTIGFKWYKSLEEINIQEFFTLLDMPDTYFSRFKIIELHIWMFLLVYPCKNRRHNIIRYSIMIAMWEDNEERAKMLATFNKNFNKNMKFMYGQFKMTLMMYDLGFFESDTSLANAIWASFFSKEDVDPRYLEVLVRFIRHQVHHLNNLNLEKIENEVKKGIWLPLKPHKDEVFKKY